MFNYELYLASLAAQANPGAPLPLPLSNNVEALQLQAQHAQAQAQALQAQAQMYNAMHLQAQARQTNSFMQHHSLFGVMNQPPTPFLPPMRSPWELPNVTASALNNHHAEFSMTSHFPEHCSSSSMKTTQQCSSYNSKGFEALGKDSLPSTFGVPASKKIVPATAKKSLSFKPLEMDTTMGKRQLPSAENDDSFKSSSESRSLFSFSNHGHTFRKRAASPLLEKSVEPERVPLLKRSQTSTVNSKSADDVDSGCQTGDILSETEAADDSFGLFKQQSTEPEVVLQPKMAQKVCSQSADDADSGCQPILEEILADTEAADLGPLCIEKQHSTKPEVLLQTEIAQMVRSKSADDVDSGCWPIREDILKDKEAAAAPTQVTQGSSKDQDCSLSSVATRLKTRFQVETLEQTAAAADVQTQTSGKKSLSLSRQSRKPQEKDDTEVESLVTLVVSSDDDTADDDFVPKHTKRSNIFHENVKQMMQQKRIGGGSGKQTSPSTSCVTPRKNAGTIGVDLETPRSNKNKKTNQMQDTDEDEDEESVDDLRPTGKKEVKQKEKKKSYDKMSKKELVQYIKEQDEKTRKKMQTRQTTALTDYNCKICMEPKEDTLTLSCEHNFCLVCVNEWYKVDKRCPLCQSIILQAPLL